MKNLEKHKVDFEALKKLAFEAVQSEEQSEKQAEAFNALMDGMAEMVAQQAETKTSEMYAAVKDNEIMISRGSRRAMTSQEMKFFNEAVQKQKLDGLDQAFPSTIIEEIVSDLVKEHPLLSAIDTRYTEAVVKYFYNDPEITAKAYWSEIPADIKQILLTGIKYLDLSVSKLSGYIAVPKGYLQLGPSWLANFVTSTLREVMTATLEEAVINGDGNLKPIGMMRKLSGALDGVYPEKTAEKITELTPQAFAGALALFSKHKLNNGQMSLIVNKVDNATKLFTARFFKDTVTGAWHENALPLGINVIESYAVPVGKAILGNPKNYLLAVAGQLELKKYEETLAIEDMDLFVAKEFVHGMPKNPNAFVVLDITGVQGATIVADAEPANIVKQDTINPKPTV
ncbi:phage major capsid protein [Vaginisenegalia massiliensis]|uniref:phage major capsid protein n=1 Tax=Vaginisenegalia massiliensis TaxID=2058294 RepID=UPI000F537A98|nr:phage major capsid protein [Vaginisenegalia massiliensis]